MSKFILARRRFLFLAPAIVAASSLMPGHSIAHLITPPIRTFWRIYEPDDFIPQHTGRLHEEFFDDNGKSLGWSRGETVDLTPAEIEAYVVKRTIKTHAWEFAERYFAELQKINPTHPYFGPYS
jgi:hypothetical protein